MGVREFHFQPAAIIRLVNRFFVQNFGCRATQADGAALESLLSAKGLEAALSAVPPISWS